MGVIDSLTKALLSSIEEVAKDNEVQKDKIETINVNIQEVNRSAQQNYDIVEETNIVAYQSKQIAYNIVKDATVKEFDGKDKVKIRKKIVDPDYRGVEKRARID
jgi:methyl-accepting chemotaxis protein